MAASGGGPCASSASVSAVRTRVASYDVAASRRVSVMLRLNGRPSGTQLVTVPGTGEASVEWGGWVGWA